MKKIILDLLVATLILSSGAVVHAESNSAIPEKVNGGPRPGINMPSKPGQMLKENMESRKEVRASTTQAIKAIRAESKEEIKEKLDERNRELGALKAQFASSTKEKKDQRQEALRKVAINRVKMLIERMQATIDRELSIAGKILTRIDKVKTNGGNTAEAENNVTLAKTHFAEAQSILDSIKNSSTTIATIIDPSTTATSTKGALEKVKSITKDIENHIKQGHKALEDSVKALRIANKGTATTTPTN